MDELHEEVPLLNIRGEVVGINTAIYSNGMAGGNLGIGFAVPINVVRELLPQLRTGKVVRGRIGVSLATQVQRDVLEQMGAKDGKGALVQQVEEGGPAAKAGVRRGDVIVDFGGQKVTDNDDLVDRVVRTKPGTSVPVGLLRDGKPTSLTVTVEELDLQSEGGRETTDEDTSTGFGMTLQDLDERAVRLARRGRSRRCRWPGWGSLPRLSRRAGGHPGGVCRGHRWGNLGGRRAVPARVCPADA